MDYTSNQCYWHNILVKMREKIAHRGKDDTGEYLKKHIGLSQTRLTIRDLYKGNQPMTRIVNNNEYTIVYNGEIYNLEPLKENLISKGYVLKLQ